VRQISQNYKTGELAIVDVAAPRASRRSILVETRVSLISAGTERSIVDLARKSLLAKARQRPDLVKRVIEKARREGPLAALDAVRAKLDLPIPLGYSLAGRVLQVGTEASGFALGDRVACAGAGYANHAELNVIPRNLAAKIPEGVTDEEASFVTVGAIALHGVRLVEPALGAVVAVIGLGLIGQIAASLLSAHGCDVVGIDVDPAKVKRALSRGAVAGAIVGQDDCAEIVRAVSAGRGADAVVITASSDTNAPLVLAGDLARDRARISVVGLVPIEVPRKTYYEKELSLVVSRSYGPGRYDPAYEEGGSDYPIGYVRWTEARNLEAVLAAIARKRLDVASLVTHRFPFEGALDAYEVITGARSEPHLGVLLTYQGEQAAASAVLTWEPSKGSQTLPRWSAAGKAGGLPTRLGVGIVGTGSFATSVLLPALAKLNGARLDAAVSRRGLSARHVANRYGAQVAASLDELLSRPSIEAVIIATRHDLHATQATVALAAGRDVFLEKPAATSEADLAKLLEAARASGRRLMVGFNRRFAPFACELKAAFEGRRAGLVMTARINAGFVPPGSWIVDPREGGGRIVGEMCHFIDLFSYFTDALPVRVSAHGLGGQGAYSGEDNLVVGLEFGDGSVASLVYTSMGDPAVGKEIYEVTCQRTMVRIDDWRGLAVTRGGHTRVSRALRADKGHAEELRQFVQACQSGQPSPIPLDSIAATTRATFAIEHARLSRATVEL
jgi:predicted dehydrogenase